MLTGRHYDEAMVLRKAAAFEKVGGSEELQGSPSAGFQRA